MKTSTKGVGLKLALKNLHQIWVIVKVLDVQHAMWFKYSISFVLCCAKLLQSCLTLCNHLIVLKAMVGLILWSPFCRCGKAVGVAAYQPGSEALKEKICPHLVRKKDNEHCDPGLPSRQLRGREELSRNPWALNNNLGEEEVGVEESALVYLWRKEKS